MSGSAYYSPEWSPEPAALLEQLFLYLYSPSRVIPNLRYGRRAMTGRVSGEIGHRLTLSKTELVANGARS